MSDDVARVSSVYDLPDEALRCKAFDHQWQEPTTRPTDGWTVPAEVWRLTCPCGRWRKDTIGADSGELFHRDYGGGTMLAPAAGVTKREARLVWRQRVAERRAGSTYIRERSAG